MPALTSLGAGDTTRRFIRLPGVMPLTTDRRPVIAMTLGDTEQTTRQRRQLAEQAIEAATRGNWQAAGGASRGLLGLGADVDAYNRLGKALAELGDTPGALEAYEQALERD